jgi:hypothetical protein
MTDDFDAKEARRFHHRFSGENLAGNLRTVEAVASIVKKKD